MDAQPSLVTADLGSLPELSPPLKSVIVAQPTDPASTVEEVSKPLPELSSVAPPLSSSDSELLTKEIDEAPLLESPSLELVIVEPPTDPSSLEIEALKPQLELSVAAMPVSSSEGIPEVSDVIDITAASGSAEPIQSGGGTNLNRSTQPVEGVKIPPQLNAEKGTGSSSVDGSAPPRSLENRVKLQMLLTTHGVIGLKVLSICPRRGKRTHYLRVKRV